jgi:hypothetical protein
MTTEAQHTCLEVRGHQIETSGQKNGRGPIYLTDDVRLFFIFGLKRLHEFVRET